MPATVADCEINQAAWNAAVAIAGGGEVWDEAGLRWSWQAHHRHLMLNFPQAIDAAAAEQGVTAARERGACIVGAWLASDVDASALKAAGFERGWEPWWMTASLESVADPDDDRVAITTEVPEYGPEGQRLLSLADAPQARAWHALARVDGHLPAAVGPLPHETSPASTTWTSGRAFNGRDWAARCCEQCALQRAPQERTQQYSTQHRTVSGCTRPRASSGSAPASPTGTISADAPGVGSASPRRPQGMRSAIRRRHPAGGESHAGPGGRCTSGATRALAAPSWCP